MLDRVTVILNIYINHFFVEKKLLSSYFITRYLETNKKEIVAWTFDYEYIFTYYQNDMGGFSFDLYDVLFCLKNTSHGSKSIPSVKYPLEAILFIIFTLRDIPEGKCNKENFFFCSYSEIFIRNPVHCNEKSTTIDINSYFLTNKLQNGTNLPCLLLLFSSTKLKSDGSK